MNSLTIAVLLCLVAAAFAHSQAQPVVEEVARAELAPEAETNPELESTVRSKRSLLLLKKKLLLGAIGLKAAKVGAVGLGVGALALKKKFQG